jgi:hypothetical protein
MKNGFVPTADGLPGAGVSVPDGFAKLTVKLRVTDAAALYVLLPAWLAVIKHGPALRSITRLLAVLHTAGVVEANVTGRPELACAAITNGETPEI